jgi:hypothetical protein
VGDSNAAIYPDQRSCLGQWGKAAFAFAWRGSVRDNPHVHAASSGLDQRLDGPRTRREAVSADKDLLLSAVDRIYRKGCAVLLGRKAQRN